MSATGAPRHDEPDNALVSRLLARRRVLILSGAAGAVILGGAGTAAGSTLDSVKPSPVWQVPLKVLPSALWITVVAPTR
ncbi:MULTISPECIES: hypothetical protein [Kitasatospora]|uniref:Uncharacterized protein n=1 Tax=Kitasatospora setae (strain ATCC 33774 / DSM 43861 / JCM 3304 / KCC A-0304 / NBRC 14216 / KM-6054) TaxID=452652 RepID=E4N784_KITSK|nr:MULTISPECIES: hypothetical protein [Kitasatospora]BAJ27065.1 hypothetical protein KSE_12320 [Kitasatospora setae KM-6054]